MDEFKDEQKFKQLTPEQVEAWIMVGRVSLVEAWIMVGRVSLVWHGSWWVELV